jgi:hypothetical protein
LAKSSVAQRAFREALTKGTLRPRTLKASPEALVERVFKGESDDTLW